VLKARAQAQKIQAIIGGKATHPVMGVPGGVSKAINNEEIKEIQGYADNLVAFAETSIGVFKSVVLENKDYLAIITNPDLYHSELYSMGLVNSKNQLEFHDGPVRVIDPEGKEHDKYDAVDYLDHIAEGVEPWSYEKFPYLRKPGYKGMTAGMDSGFYRATPLGRLNACEGISTPKAQAAYEEFRGTFKSLGVTGPVHFNLATHWARIIEMLYAAEKVQAHANDPNITDANIKQKDLVPGGRGVGCVEAPRGTLTHDYVCDENGIVTACNLVVGTTNNNGPMNLDVAKIAKALIKDHEVSPGLLNMVEMAFRVYDPCNSCATHSLPGQMPLKATIRHADGTTESISRNL
jgi:F420-non-reducing hydrogenase large subunit